MEGLLIALLNAMVKAGMGALADAIGGAIAAWYMGRQSGKTLQEIADTAAFALHNEGTEEGRYQSAERWQKTLSRPRYSK